VLSSNWLLGRESPCTGPLVCGPAFPRAASATPQCLAPGYRWLECEALEGHRTEHHRFLLQLLWKQLAQQEELLTELDRKIEDQTRPFVAEIDRLDAVPGVDCRVAEVVLAEVGADMKPFPTHENLASWAEMCPGNEESAGKRQRRRITPGNRWLKRTLAQAAWAASRTKNGYLASQYRRLAGHRGRKRA